MIFSKHIGLILRLSVLLPVFLLAGCNWVVLDPKGPIGQDEKTLLITATGLMLLVVIPVCIMTLAFAWKYRASAKARYEPNWSHSNKIEVVVWTIPCIIILILAVLTWRTSHSLDPYKPLTSTVKPLRVEVVALDWKWLFIYPDLGIATINELDFPIGTPINFDITSDTVMNAFFIPQLGSQIYAMSGMVTKLHLMADEAGNYLGFSGNYSGHGFSKMHFTAHALSSKSDFDEWVNKVRASGTPLDMKTVDAVGNNRNIEHVYPVTYYGSVQQGVFDQIVDKHMSMSPSSPAFPSGTKPEEKQHMEMNGMHMSMDSDKSMQMHSLGNNSAPLPANDYAVGYFNGAATPHMPVAVARSWEKK